MVDLIVPAGTVLKIDQASQVAPRYGLFRMDANAKIVAAIDLRIKASRAEFAAGCVIDASGHAAAPPSSVMISRRFISIPSSARATSPLGFGIV
jgi:hypothetical protein